jgi:hypothetical protein
MSRRFRSSLIVGFAASIAALSIAAPVAAAESHDRHVAVRHAQHFETRGPVRASRRVYPMRRGGAQFAYRLRPNQIAPYIPPTAIRMPGYVFVPGVGILGESCDLPTSACPNQYRDIQ